MYANDPKMAKKWQAHTPKNKKLPNKIKKKRNTESLDATTLVEAMQDPLDAMTSFGTSDYLKQYWKFQIAVNKTINDTIENYPALIEILEEVDGQSVLDRFNDGEISLADFFSHLEAAIEAAETTNTFSRPDRISDD